MGHWFPCFVIIAIEQKTCVKLLSTTMYHFQPVELKCRLDHSLLSITTCSPLPEAGSRSTVGHSHPKVGGERGSLPILYLVTPVCGVTGLVHGKIFMCRTP